MNDLKFYEGKSIFLTGHTGFKGSWLSGILKMAGAKVHGYALPPPRNGSAFIECGIDRRMVSWNGDIRDAKGLGARIREASPEIVFHLAAQPLVRASYENPAETYEVNVMGTVNLLEALRLCDSVRSVVIVTTDKVYENKEWAWAYRENENLCGLDPYSNSKSCCELVTHSYRESFFNRDGSPAISTARSGNVIGGGDYSADRIIPDCIRDTISGKPIIVRNPGSIRPYQHVLDCLFGYLRLAEMQWRDPKMAGAYNFGPDEASEVTTGSLVELFCSLWDGSDWIARGDGGPHEAGLLRLDSSRAKKTLGWKPRWDIREAVKRTIQYARTETGGRAACMERQIRDYFEDGSGE